MLALIHFGLVELGLEPWLLRFRLGAGAGHGKAPVGAGRGRDRDAVGGSGLGCGPPVPPVVSVSVCADMVTKCFYLFAVAYCQRQCIVVY